MSLAVPVPATGPRPSYSLFPLFLAPGLLPSASGPSLGQVLQARRWSGAQSPSPRRGGGTPDRPPHGPYPFSAGLLLRPPADPGTAWLGGQVPRCGGSEGCGRRPRGLGRQLAGALTGGTGSRAGRGGKGRGREARRGAGRGVAVELVGPRPHCAAAAARGWSLRAPRAFPASPCASPARLRAPRPLSEIALCHHEALPLCPL